MFFPSYNPYGPHGAKASPTAPDVPPLAVFKAAQRAGPLRLSADGRRVYTMRYGQVFEAEWVGPAFGAWWPVSEMPADAVRIE